MCHLGACPILTLKFAIVSFLLFPHNSVQNKRGELIEGDFLLPTCYFNNRNVIKGKTVAPHKYIAFQEFILQTTHLNISFCN